MENEGFDMDDSFQTTKSHKNGLPPNANQNENKGNDDTNKNSTVVEVHHEDLEFNGETVFFARGIQKARDGIYKVGMHHKKILKSVLIVTIFLLYNAYLAGAIYHAADSGIKVDWCDGVGFLIVLTGLVYWSLFYYFVIKKHLGKRIKRALAPLNSKLAIIWSNRFVPPVFYLLVLAGVLTFLILDSRGDERRLISLIGVIVILTCCLLISKHPGRVIWRQVMWGLALQFIMALVILRWDVGRNVMNCISTKISTFLNFANEGSAFIYSYLASGNANVTLTWTPSGSTPIESNALIALPGVFVFQALSVIYFFGFFVSLMYHLGAMTWVVSKLGWFLQITVGTTAAESMSAAANIFLGQSEAPLLIQPYLPVMTDSELHAIMTGGFSTIAGGVMAAYISFGIDAGYLLSASVMAAPAALGLSKLVYPETKVSRTTAESIQNIETKANGNALDAAAQGAVQGIILVGCIVANLIAFISFIAFLNAVVSWLGLLVGADYLSFEWILGKLFIPFAWVIGVPWDECEDVALLLGLKVVVNEFVAYERLVTRMTHLSERSKVISTYALCSFANFSSIGIQLGGIGALAPTRRQDLARIIGRAFITGTASGLLMGCMAGMLISSDVDSTSSTITTLSVF